MAAFFKSIFSRPGHLPEYFNNKAFIMPLGITANFLGQSNPLREFAEIPELNAIINIHAKAKASWRLRIVNKKTGKDQPNQQSLVRILRAPNWFQGGGELWKTSSIFRDIYGNEYLFFLTPYGMPETYKGLFTLDPALTDIKYKPEQAYFFDATGEGVVYTYKLPSGETIPIQRENIIHLNDNRVATSTDLLKGTSKIKSLEGPLANIRAAYNKRNISLKMPVGIMSNGQADAMGSAVPMDDKDKRQAKQDLADSGASAILTNLAVKYNEMNVDARKMGLFDETAESTGRICDAYGVPYKLLAQQKGNVLNSSGTELREARKQMYEETVIPENQETVDALNLKLETSGKPYEVRATYDHLPVFQTDIMNRATALNTMVTALTTALNAGAITLKQYQAELVKFGL